VGADQDFEAFLGEWAEEYIWPVENFLDDRDQTYLAERRSIELVQLAQKKGFSNELAEKVKSYGLQPDVILAANAPAATAVRSETRTIPIVFVTVADPVGAGFVASLPRPGGSMTGFISIEGGMGGKWARISWRAPW
jgi:hypothetical protein